MQLKSLDDVKQLQSEGKILVLLHIIFLVTLAPILVA